jgi:hypothetical protein
MVSRIVEPMWKRKRFVRSEVRKIAEIPRLIREKANNNKTSTAHGGSKMLFGH